MRHRPSPRIADIKTEGLGRTLSFGLFLLVNAMLFIRPAEFHPVLMGMPIYELCIITCFSISYPTLIARLRARELLSRPVVLCSLAMLPAVALSHLANVEPYRAYQDGVEFLKLLLYLFLLVSVVDTTARLEQFLTALAWFALTITTLAVAHYHGLWDVPALEFIRTDGDGTGRAETMIKRLGSTGLFQDPNDMCLMLVMALMICLYRILERRRFLWALPMVLFGHALMLTHSRGGFLALVAALVVFLASRLGKRALPLALLVLPGVFALFAGRQTSISLNEGTGAARVWLWNEGLHLFLRKPLFGIGANRYEEYIGHVAHNSFIHCYVELGMMGGTLFLSAFYIAFWALHRLGGREVPPVSERLAGLRPYVMAIVAGYGAGLLSLSCSYTIPTYTVLGLSAVCVRLYEAELGVAVARVNGLLLGRLALLSAAFIIVANVGVRWLV